MTHAHLLTSDETTALLAQWFPADQKIKPFGWIVKETMDALMGESADTLDPVVAKPTAMLSFADKAGYLKCRAAWKARQKAIEGHIRALKQARKEGSIDSRGEAQHQAYVWGNLARVALMERHVQKRLAARQWAAAQETVQDETKAGKA